MDFDIHQLDQIEPGSEEAEEAFEEYRDAIMDRFFESPEGKARLEVDPDMGFWAAQLMYYGYQYVGVSVPEMSVRDVREVVTDLFPRKVSTLSPEDADDAIPELTAFWEYLKREFHLAQADDVLKLLREVEPEFKRAMNDPANFGMAKSFFTMGQAAGFDMTSEEGMHAFAAAYNASVAARQAPGLGPPGFSLPAPHVFGTVGHRDPKAEKKVRKKRRQAEAARKRNRKRGK